MKGGHLDGRGGSRRRREGGGSAVGTIRSVVVSALTLLAASPVLASEARPPTLTGEAARDRIVGNTLDGATADGPYTLFFAGDGRLVSSDRDGRVDGTWVLRDAKLCTTLPDEDEECRVLEVSGSNGNFVDSDGSRYPFTIAPGNPKGF